VQTKPVQRFDVRFNQTPTGPMLVRGMDAFELNEVGLAVWRMCDGAHSVDDIVKHVADDFAVGQDQAAQDVNEFIAALRHARLLD
jgi:hypothetical protein